MKLGTAYAFSAYVLWGLLTIYWKLLDDVRPMEVLAHRIVWSFLFMLLLLVILREFRSFLAECKKLLRNSRRLVSITAAAFLISLNWFTFIWAVANDHVLQASLGYYINPLVSILLGIVVLRETFTARQGISFLLATIGVLYLTFSGGIFPWISLILAFSFGLYGLLKKKIHLSAVHGLTIETMIVTPIALLYLAFLPSHAFSLDGVISETNVLLIGAGIATAVPLLLFASGAKAIPLAMVGILQFVAPTIMFFLGIFFYNEPFSFDQFIAFVFIWSALVLYLSTVYYKPAKRRKRS